MRRRDGVGGGSLSSMAQKLRISPNLSSWTRGPNVPFLNGVNETIANEENEEDELARGEKGRVTTCLGILGRSLEGAHAIYSN